MDFGKLTEDLPTAPPGVCWRPLHKYNDAWFYRIHLEGALRAQNRFQSRPEDIVVCSFPKTGTTWLKALTFAVATRAQFDIESPNHPLRSHTPHDCAPILEYELEKILATTQTPRILSTHVPYAHLPDSIQNSASKILYVWRDPKDCLVSYTHFLSGLKFGNGVETNEIPVQDASSQFNQGIVPFGPYWDHVIGFLKTSQEQPRKILCFRYEELMNDNHGCVRRLAEFIAKPFSQLEEQQGVVDKIIDLCSFKSLRNSKATESGALHSEDGQVVIQNRFFYRQGRVGDWKNHLSDQAANDMDNLFEEKFSAAGLRFEPQR